MIAALLLAVPAAAQTVDVTAEIAPLIDSARAAISQMSEPDVTTAAARLAEVQARLGDVDGARVTARTLGRNSWFAHARAAIAQVDRGDHAGALATTRLVSGFTDRAQAMGYLASSYIYAGDVKRGESITRKIDWPKQKIEELKLLAQSVREDTARAYAYLREAVRVASRDAGNWGSYFWIELAYDQAEHGDLQGALRIVSDTLPAAIQAERLARIAREMQRSKMPDRAGEVADSLFRAALQAAELEKAPDRRDEVRARVFELYRFYADSASREVIRVESRSEAERVRALVDIAGGGMGDDLDVRRARAAAGELVDRGEHAAAAKALTALLTSLALRENWGLGGGEYVRLGADTLAPEAIRLAERHDPALGDTARLRLVEILSLGDLPAARRIADGIDDPYLRSAAMAKVASRWAIDAQESTDRPDTTIRGVIRYAARIPDDTLRDRALLEVARWSAYRNRNTALAAAKQVRSDSVRGMALAYIAEQSVKHHPDRARALYTQALPLLNPLDLADPGRGILRVASSLLELGELRMLARWAAAQTMPDRRAAAYIEILEAIAAER